jgi:Tol biopolymer transport system component
VYSPDGQWVVFSSNRSGTGNLDLWAVSRASGAVRRLTDDPGIEWDPAFTADGRHLLWSSNRGGHFECWIADADGARSRRVTSDGVDAQNPTATPDGQWIVYASLNTRQPGLWKVRSDGSGATRLVSGTVNMPEVSPDGQYVLYQTGAGRAASIQVVRLADGARVPFEIQVVEHERTLADLGRARWMRGRQAIAFLGQDESGATGVFVQDFLPGQDTAHTRTALAGFSSDAAAESFAIAPDGKRIVIAYWEQLFDIVSAENLLGLLDRTR